MSQYTTEQLERCAFFALCDKFDWLYTFSDDNKVYQTGLKFEQAIHNHLRENPELHDIYDAFINYWESTYNGKPANKPSPVEFLNF